MPDEPRPEDTHLAPMDADTTGIADGAEVLPGVEPISQDPTHLPEGTVTGEGA